MHSSRGRSVSSSCVVAFIISCILIAAHVHAIEYTLESNCFGYDWNGLGCAEVGQNSTVPVGSHSVTIGGTNITAHPVIFVTNTTTKELWPEMSLVATGLTEGTYYFNVTEDDVGNKLYYQDVSFGFFGTLIFVEALDESDSSTGSSNDNDTASTATDITDFSSSGDAFNSTDIDSTGSIDYNSTDYSSSASDVVSSTGSDSDNSTSTESSSGSYVTSSTGPMPPPPRPSTGMPPPPPRPFSSTGVGLGDGNDDSSAATVVPVAITVLSVLVAASVFA